MSKGIYTKENVGNDVFIFTVNKNFVEPKFWGLHEENEQAQCAVIMAQLQISVAYFCSIGLYFLV